MACLHLRGGRREGRGGSTVTSASQVSRAGLAMAEKAGMHASGMAKVRLRLTCPRAVQF